MRNKNKKTFQQTFVFKYKHINTFLKWIKHILIYLKVHFKLASSGNSQAECGRIDASITLAKNEKLILGEIWELGEKALQSQVVVVCHLKKKCIFRLSEVFKGY